MKKFAGFTLVEMLIVILIIGILLGFTISALYGSRKSARDAKRKADLTILASALEHYHADFGIYPTTGGDSCGQGGIFASGGGLIPTYLGSAVIDPINNPSISPQRCYWYRSDTSKWKLVTSLEGSPGVVYELCSNGKTGTTASPTMGDGVCNI